MIINGLLHSTVSCGVTITKGLDLKALLLFVCYVNMQNYNKNTNFTVFLKSFCHSVSVNMYIQIIQSDCRVKNKTNLNTAGAHEWLDKTTALILFTYLNAPPPPPVCWSLSAVSVKNTMRPPERKPDTVD